VLTWLRLAIIGKMAKKSKNKLKTAGDLKPKTKSKKVKDPTHVHETNAQNKAILYLKLWYDDKKGVSNTKWKFQKCKQIWLLSHCFDNKKIPAKEFKLLIKYMKTIQGRMLEASIKDAKEKLEFSEKWEHMVSEGKLESDIALELKKPKLDEITILRAKKIVKKLSKTADDDDKEEDKTGSN